MMKIFISEVLVIIVRTISDFIFQSKPGQNILNYLPVKNQISPIYSQCNSLTMHQVSYRPVASIILYMHLSVLFDVKLMKMINSIKMLTINTS